MKKAKKITPTAGARISDVACGAAADALLEQVPHEFYFNGVLVSIRIPKDSGEIETIAEEAECAYLAELEAWRKAREASPDGKRAAAKRALEVAQAQSDLDALMTHMPSSGRHDDWMAWLKVFTGIADVAGVKFDSGKVAKALEAAGYVEGFGVIDDDATLATRKCQQEALRTRAPVLARYIAGQVLACLKGRGPFGSIAPHPITIKFIEDYEKLARGEALSEEGK